MSLPKFLAPYLASYDLNKLDPNSNGVKKEVISQILNTGSFSAVFWLFQKYTINDIKDALTQPDRGSWTEKSLNYWQKILNAKSSNLLYKNALLTNP